MGKHISNNQFFTRVLTNYSAKEIADNPVTFCLLNGVDVTIDKLQ